MSARWMTFAGGRELPTGELQHITVAEPAAASQVPLIADELKVGLTSDKRRGPNRLRLNYRGAPQIDLSADFASTRTKLP